MAQQTQNPKLPDAALRKPKAEPLWLWFTLIMGSAVIHAGLAIVAIPLLRQLSGSEIQLAASVPIELIDLPAESAESSGASQASAQAEIKSALASIAASSPQSSSGQTPSAPSPAGVAPAKLPQSLAPIAATDSSRGSPLPRTPSRATPPAPTESAASSEATETGTDSDAGASPLPQLTPTETSPTETSPTQASPTETPRFATIPIEIPTPDVSETLPVSPSPAPASPLAQVGVSRENAPVNLTVSLDFERIPAAEAGDNPDRLAAPKNDIDSQEISTVDESACAGALKPEILQALGVKVALQVSTDASGQVTQTAAQVPSRNAAYNELARCLVQHWGFVPAEAAGEPVPSNALRVWVTIDRS